jgi:hypothetical protein
MKKFGLLAGLALLAACSVPGSDAAVDSLLGPSSIVIPNYCVRVRVQVKLSTGENVHIDAAQASPSLPAAGTVRLVTPAGGDRFAGTVNTMTCTVNGSIVAHLDGIGEFNGIAGHTFLMVVHDTEVTDTVTLVVMDGDGNTVYVIQEAYEHGRAVIELEPLTSPAS